MFMALYDAVPLFQGPEIAIDMGAANGGTPK